MQNILHKRKAERLEKEGLWKNLNETESAKEWLDSKLETFVAERIQSVRIVPIDDEVVLTKAKKPITSTIDFSGLFLLAGLHRRRKPYKAHSELLVSFVSHVKAKLVCAIVPRLNNSTSFPKGLAYLPFIKQKRLLLLLLCKARSSIWKPWLEETKRYVIAEIKRCPLKFLLLEKLVLPFKTRKDRILMLRVLINGT